MVTVTAIMVNYHGAPDIVRAAHTVRADAPDASLVVVDNSESDEQAAHLRAHLPAGAQVLVPARNLGFGAACNLGAAHYPADAYLLVNPDVRLIPGCVPRLVDALVQHPVLGAVAPRQYLDERRLWQFSPAWLPSAIGAWARERALRDARLQSWLGRAVQAESVRLWRASEDHPPIRQRALSGAVMLVRHACLDPAFGLFDPRYFMYFEDSDLCVRLRKRGWQMAVVPGAMALHLWEMGDHKDGLMAASAPVFFQTHHAGSRWLDKLAQLQAQPAGAPNSVPWPRGTDLSVPVAWQAGWVLELSPLPALLPSVGSVGLGPVVPWPEAVVGATRGEPLFARLTPLHGSGQFPVRAVTVK